MAGTTTKGYPYPTGGDLVAAGDDAIAALAQAVDSKAGALASGQATVNVTTGGSASSLAVTFPAGRFTVAPIVTVAYATTANLNVTVGVASVTTTGCVVSAIRQTSGTLAVNWIAHQS